MPAPHTAFPRHYPYRQALAGWVAIALVTAAGCAAGPVLTTSEQLRSHAGPVEAPVPMPDQQPAFLRHDELVQLSQEPYPRGEVRSRFQALWSTPIVDNSAWRRGVKPIAPELPGLGPGMRVVSWNIEKSLQMDAAIDVFSDAEAFAQRIDPAKAPSGSQAREALLQERAILAAADVILLQEMDIGVKRSGYRNAAGDLARALDMNYAYAPEYLEVDPVILGLEPVLDDEGRPVPESTEYYRVDRERYHGMFGVAVLSRYPIVYVEAFPLFRQGYDWYWQEKLKPSFMEKARRFGARQVFLERPHRETKVGGRTFMRVDLHVPQLPRQRLSIINVHLEIKAEPHARAAQIAEILEYVRGIEHPVVLMGDFNTAPWDLSATSTPRVVGRELEAPEFWLSRTIDFLFPTSLVLNTTRAIANVTKNFHNPTAVHVPIVGPNESAELFRIIERFRFDDGGAFDFRGQEARSAGSAGLLSNANERNAWAYETTYQVRRTIAQMIGKYRLDWAFVKSYLAHPHDEAGAYQFAPHFGRTLGRINPGLEQRVSDHHPISIDLPFGEPDL